MCPDTSDISSLLHCLVPKWFSNVAKTNHQMDTARPSKLKSETSTSERVLVHRGLHCPPLRLTSERRIDHVDQRGRHAKSKTGEQLLCSQTGHAPVTENCCIFRIVFKVTLPSRTVRDGSVTVVCVLKNEPKTRHVRGVIAKHHAHLMQPGENDAPSLHPRPSVRPSVRQRVFL